MISSSTAMNHLRLLGMGRSAVVILLSCDIEPRPSNAPPPPSLAAATQRFTPSRRDCTAHRSGCPATPSQQPPARLRLFGLGWAAQQFSARAPTAGTRAQRRRRPTGAWPWSRATRRPTRAARGMKRRQTLSRRRPHMQQGSFRSTRRDGKLCLPSRSIVYARRRCCFSISWR